jgi:Ala-tRNA(Pro) deacylase
MEAVMSIAPTLQRHLDRNVTYDVITHEATMSSTRTAQACHVSGDCLAKAIVLRHDGGYMLAVPASHHPPHGSEAPISDDVALADEGNQTAVPTARSVRSPVPRYGRT